jgi:hypothetical protein
MPPHSAARSSPSNNVARTFVLVLGLCSLAWAIQAYPVFRADAPIERTAKRILGGDELPLAQIPVLKAQLAMPERLGPTALTWAAVVRLRIAEIELAAGTSQAAIAKVAGLEGPINEAIAATPSAPFLWLMLCWLETVRGGQVSRGETFSRMSYQLGPNEGWIAIRRNALALAAFASPPADIEEQVVCEFAELVRSQFYSEAAQILAGPGWSVRERLLKGLSGLNESDRRTFSNVLESKGLDGAMVPGLPKRDDRPF